MNSMPMQKAAPLVDVIIEVPRGSFLKRGLTGEIDFISPLPCPFNYGSIPAFIGMDGDLLDAVVLGPRIPFGTKVTVQAWGAIGMIDQGLYEDKLICSHSPIPSWKLRLIHLYFRFYAKAKTVLNVLRGRWHLNSCEGWCEVDAALARAKPAKIRF